MSGLKTIVSLWVQIGKATDQKVGGVGCELVPDFRTRGGAEGDLGSQLEVPLPMTFSSLMFPAQKGGKW